MNGNLPENVTKYFWGDNLESLNWHDHKQYIVKTLLEKGDSEAISWLMKQTHKDELLSLLPQIKLTPKSDNFWRHYLS